jgi:hypothetical protein
MEYLVPAPQRSPWSGWPRRRVARLDHPVDHPDDPTGLVWTRRDRRATQPEQGRSVWTRSDRRGAPGYGSGGQAMAVLTDATHSGPVPGPTSGVAVDGSAAGCPAWPCRRVRTTLPPSRVSAAPGTCGLPCPPAASAVHESGPSMSTGGADLPATPAGVHRTGHRGSVCGASGSAAGCWPDGRCPPRTWPQAADCPCTPAGCGNGPRPPPAGPRQQHLHPPGVQTRCPPHGRPPPAETARCPMWLRTCGTWRCRPDGWWWPPGGVQVAAQPDAAAASPVRRRFRHRGRVSMHPDGRCPDGRCRPRTPAPGYRTSSPGRRPLECRHRRGVWPTCRVSRSPSQARAKVIAGRSNAKASSSLSHQTSGPGGGHAASRR